LPKSATPIRHVVENGSTKRFVVAVWH